MTLGAEVMRSNKYDKLPLDFCAKIFRSELTMIAQRCGQHISRRLSFQGACARALARACLRGRFCYANCVFAHALLCCCCGSVLMLACVIA